MHVIWHETVRGKFKPIPTCRTPKLLQNHADDFRVAKCLAPLMRAEREEVRMPTAITEFAEPRRPGHRRSASQVGYRRRPRRRNPPPRKETRVGVAPGPGGSSGCSRECAGA